MKLEIKLPTLHSGQVNCWNNRARFNAIRCGRRFGKDVLQNTIAANAALKGKRAALFAPEYKQLAEPYDALSEILDPIKKRSSRTDGTIKTLTGGIIDFWTLDDNPLAGRGREYDVILINEAGFTKSPQMLNEIWPKSIRPTLLVRKGAVWAFSTPNGIDPENFFYSICNDPSQGFKEFHAPTVANPYIDPDEIEQERGKLHPLVFQQEILAEFVDWSGEAFFAREKMLDDGQPLPFPSICDGVYAVVDTAVKDGKAHDGTAVMYFSLSRHVGPPLMVLDWDIVQIEGSLLETWLPTVYQRCEELAGLCRARMGHLGAFIEDKASGTILLQQAARRGWPATAIDSKLTAVGKDERAISVSGYVHRDMVKVSQHAFDKIVTYKGTARNHFLSQVLGFRIGDKDAHKRADDLVDTFTYGIAIGLGDKDGY